MKVIINVTALILIVLFPLEANAKAKVVRTLKHGPGQWELLVNDQPYFIKGVVYSVTVVGDDPSASTLRDWAILDLNKNARNDAAYESWVDANGNNQRDEDEPVVGDWQLLKDMNANTIRVYQMASDDPGVTGLYNTTNTQLTFNHAPNKDMFRDLAQNYGIMVIVGHFFGEWAIGSGADPADGTDYTDPVQRKNILMSVRVMVEEHKDEPYTLMWLLGNENFMPFDLDNAEKEPEAFLTLLNEAAELIHELDPNHPVAVCNWVLEHLDKFAQYAPAVDIFGMNNYRSGFQEEWNAVRDTFDRPVMLTEFGFQAKMKHFLDEGAQARYHMTSWKDIKDNAYKGSGVGNSIGGVVFSWNDQWYLGGAPLEHDTGDFYGVTGAEWFGLTTQGDGSDSPFMRGLRKAYWVYKDLWAGEDKN